MLCHWILQNPRYAALDGCSPTQGTIHLFHVVGHTDYDDVGRGSRPVRAFVLSRRFQFYGGVLLAAVLPFIVQLYASPPGPAPEKSYALGANLLAVVIAFWMRCSIEEYPGIRRSYVIVPTVLAGHGVAIAALLATRLPYSRLGIAVGLILHIGWLYIHYVGLERRVRRRIAVVPSGGVQMLAEVPNVEWRWLKRPRLNDARGCEAIVADFSADLPGEWEAFLAEAAISGRLVYQHKQLSESLSGRVQLEHLSENTFGSLLPSRGYFHAKTVMDFLVAVLALPAAFLVIAVASLGICVETRGSPWFKQKRIGHRGQEFMVYKLRTMGSGSGSGSGLVDCPRAAAMTLDDDCRITRLGQVLRKYRIDELPQIFNILKGEMSWIGPRPEASALSDWYRGEIPFYVYRHVVKPGISGWAQVNQGHVANVDEVHLKLQFDFYYIKYFSPWLDLLILLRTIKTMVIGFGSK